MALGESMMAKMAFLDAAIFAASPLKAEAWPRPMAAKTTAKKLVIKSPKVIWPAAMNSTPARKAMA